MSSLRTHIGRYIIIVFGIQQLTYLDLPATQTISRFTKTVARSLGSPHTTASISRQAVQNRCKHNVNLFFCSTIFLLHSSGGQGSLDDIVIRQPRVPAFSTSGLLDYLVELVVCEDHVSSLATKSICL
jgi:hypothetical protein